MIAKLFAGGWFPLVVAAAIFMVMSTWQKGRALLAKRVQNTLVPLDDFFELMTVEPTVRVPGTAVYMTSNPTGTPPALMNNFLHNHSVHEQVILLTIVVEEMARVEDRERVTLEDEKHGFKRLVARYGFMETPDILAAPRARRHAQPTDRLHHVLPGQRDCARR